MTTFQYCICYKNVHCSHKVILFTQFITFSETGVNLLFQLPVLIHPEGQTLRELGGEAVSQVQAHKVCVDLWYCLCHQWSQTWPQVRILTDCEVLGYAAQKGAPLGVLCSTLLIL